MVSKDEIIEMAREAGIRDCTCDGTKGCLERFAALVAQKEREACAKLCDEMEDQYWRSTEDQSNFTPVDCSDAIRARKP